MKWRCPESSSLSETEGADNEDCPKWMLLEVGLWLKWDASQNGKLSL